MRRSRALPYELHVHGRAEADKGKLTLTFKNRGPMGAVFHVYNRLHLERIPRRYSVEAGKALTDEWLLHDDQGRYDLWVYGPNGFLREFRGLLQTGAPAHPEVELKYDPANLTIAVVASNEGRSAANLIVSANAYRTDGPWSLRVAPRQRVVREWSLTTSYGWYDFFVRSEQFERRDDCFPTI